ncbi:heavy-metal-associated domain-containing protein [Caproiciproducens sp. MSJ-32]|uniref:heavy-metal-associated domain-containing protein n=1 Tax=Caproiciproducens sp. MSJ-32 TaxID=2841527 RepID=UPI001C0F658D|nr:heavy-metal-associated domain-containing protein [Caproiciproducens sp. MSJ-32]MBU5455675.1 heavy-metal-associated domain-containing protein [Caproiciproducens sp. MSJ-32]
MKSFLKVPNMKDNKDVAIIREAIAKNIGVIACEILFSKKEVTIFYDESSITLEDLISSIEDMGYTVI